MWTLIAHVYEIFVLFLNYRLKKYQLKSIKLCVILKKYNLIIKMGCVPPERNQQSTASASASNPIKKTPSIKRIDSHRSKNSSNSTDRQLKASVQNISSSQSLKQVAKSN